MVNHKIYKVVIEKSDESNQVIVGIGRMDRCGHCVSYGTYENKEADSIIRRFEELEASMKTCNVYGLFND